MSLSADSCGKKGGTALGIQGVGGYDDSPIIVSGGSLTIHAQHAWINGSKSNLKETSFKASQIDFYNLKSPVKNLTQIGTNWSIELHMRSATGKVNGADGKPQPHGLKLQQDGSLVRVYALSADSTLKDDSSNNFDSGYQNLLRYKYNQGCDVNKGELCEHIGTVVITANGQSNSYTCYDGECRILIH